VHRESNCTHTRVDLLIPFLPSRVPHPAPRGAPRILAASRGTLGPSPTAGRSAADCCAARGFKRWINWRELAKRSGITVRENCSVADMAIQSAVVIVVYSSIWMRIDKLMNSFNDRCKPWQWLYRSIRLFRRYFAFLNIKTFHSSRNATDIKFNSTITNENSCYAELSEN